MTSNLGSEYILDNEDNAEEKVLNELKNTSVPNLSIVLMKLLSSILYIKMS